MKVDISPRRHAHRRLGGDPLPASTASIQSSDAAASGGRLKALFWRVVKLTFGGIIIASALELLLVPNSIIDGGITGISIMVSYLTGLPLGALTFILNLPFIGFGYQQIGRTFVFSTLYAIAVYSLFLTLLGPYGPITHDLLLATVFGGVLLGLGVGIVVRNGGSSDGTEIMALVSGRGLGFSVGETVMFLNLFILGAAGFVFGWDRAMYSLIAYFIAFKTIDVVIVGFEESKAVTIISTHYDEIENVIIHRLGRTVTRLHGQRGYSKEPTDVLYCVVTRLEVAKLKSIVSEQDPNAFVAIENVHDVIGGRFAKRNIH